MVKRAFGVFLGAVFSLLLVAAFMMQVVEAQPPAGGWAKTYGGAGSESATSVVQTSDGGYALAGYKDLSFWLVKTDGNGNALWNKTYGKTGYDMANSVVQTSDGGYALAGYINPLYQNKTDAWLVKTDASGNALWNKTYGGTRDDFVNSIVQATDGGYALAGFSEAEGYDFWLVKTDGNGNALWNKTYKAGGYERASCVVRTIDGGYALAGVGGMIGNNFWLVKTDANGNALWNKTYRGTGNSWAQSVVQTSDGGYALAGYNWIYDGIYDFWLVKTDANGNAIWNKTYGGTGVDDAYSVVQTSDGGYAIAGHTESYGAGNLDFWLVRTDANGNALWNKTYGGTNEEWEASVVRTSDGGYAIAGYTRSFGAGLTDAWLVKVDASGMIPEFPSSMVPLVLVVAVTSMAVLLKKKPRAGVRALSASM